MLQLKIKNVHIRKNNRKIQNKKIELNKTERKTSIKIKIRVRKNSQKIPWEVIFQGGSFPGGNFP